VVLDSVLEAASTASNLGYVSRSAVAIHSGSDRTRSIATRGTYLEMDIFTASASAINSAGHFCQESGPDGYQGLKGGRRLKLAVSCFEASGADGIWVVDSTLDDHASLRKLENQRLPGIINFHEELNARLVKLRRTL